MDKRIAEIPDNMAIVMSYPRIQMMMCGILDVRQTNDGTIKLTYEDMSKENRKSDKYIEDFDSCFSVVGYVQDGRIK